MKFRTAFLDFCISITQANVEEILTYISDISSFPQGVFLQNSKDLSTLTEVVAIIRDEISLFTTSKRSMQH